MNRHCETEYFIARHCGVAMAGLKAASLVQYPKGGERCVSHLRKSLGKNGIRFRALETKKAKLMLVYREEVLLRHLTFGENRDYLVAAGYPESGTVAGYISVLEERLAREDFPHEIGIFLGYPIEDVLGFVERPHSCEYCGVWKVYKNAEEKKKLFARYKVCSERIIDMVRTGKQLAEIF